VKNLTQCHLVLRIYYTNWIFALRRQRRKLFKDASSILEVRPISMRWDYDCTRFHACMVPDWLLAGRPEIVSRQGRGFLLSPPRLCGLPILPPIPEVKRPQRETDNSPPSGVEIKNAWRCTSTPRYFFMVWRLINYKDNFIFILILALKYRRQARVVPLLPFLGA